MKYHDIPKIAIDCCHNVNNPVPMDGITTLSFPPTPNTHPTLLLSAHSLYTESVNWWRCLKIQQYSYHYNRSNSTTLSFRKVTYAKRLEHEKYGNIATANTAGSIPTVSYF